MQVGSTPKAPMLETILKTVIGLFVAYSISRALYERRRDLGFILEVWKQFTFKRFGLALLGVALTISFFLFLYELHPFFRWGWYELIAGEAGNIAVAPASEAARQGGIVGSLVATLFTGALLLAVPFLALYEEVIFRMGIRDWKGWVLQACIFGPIHLIVGVPIAVGIALILMGLLWGGIYWYDYHYGIGPAHSPLVARLVARRGGDIDDQRAVEQSALVHACYNTLLIVPLFLASLTLTLLYLFR